MGPLSNDLCEAHIICHICLSGPDFSCGRTDGRTKDLKKETARLVQRGIPKSSHQLWRRRES